MCIRVKPGLCSPSVLLNSEAVPLCFWLRAFVTVPFKSAHFMWKKKSSNQQAVLKYLPFGAQFVVSSLDEAATTVGTRVGFAKQSTLLLKSSAMVKSHRRTFCLVLLHLHSCLPWVPLFQPVCCAAQICETLNWWLFHIDGPRLQLKALQLLHSDPWPSSCFLSVTQMSSCTKMLIWYFILKLILKTANRFFCLFVFIPSQYRCSSKRL